MWLRCREHTPASKHKIRRSCAPRPRRSSFFPFLCCVRKSTSTVPSQQCAQKPIVRVSFEAPEVSTASTLVTARVTDAFPTVQNATAPRPPTCLISSTFLISNVLLHSSNSITPNLSPPYFTLRSTVHQAAFNHTTYLTSLLKPIKRHEFQYACPAKPTADKSFCE